MMVSKKWKPPKQINEPLVFAYGSTGSGKTFKLLSIIQYYQAHSHKIWDLFGGLRKEGPFWCFPSDEKKLWREYQKEVGIMKEPGPKKYKVDLAIPYLEKELPNKVPENKPRINTKVFTIYFKDITTSMISTITGELSRKQKRIWRNIKNELPDDSNGQDILDWFEQDEEHKKKKRWTLYKDFILPMCEQKLLSSKNSPYNLDLEEEANNKDRIFVMYEEHVPTKDKNWRFFFISYFINMLFDLVLDNKIHKKNICFFRELNKFMKVVDSSSEDAEIKKILRNQFSEVGRYGRSGIFIFGDTQSPKEVKGLIEGQHSFLVINRMSSPKDREYLCEPLVQSGSMHPKHVEYLDKMPDHQMAVVEVQKKAVLVKRVQPPRTRGWKRADGNFMNVWKKLINNFKDLKEQKEDIKDRYLKANNVYISNNNETKKEDKEELSQSDDFSSEEELIEEGEDKEELRENIEEVEKQEIKENEMEILDTV